MSHNGSWGGDLEINAISKYYKCNIIVFQDSRPNLELQSFPKDSRLIQLAYFGSCHYNSVRSSKPLTLSDKSSQDNIVLRSDEQEIQQKKMAGKPKSEKPVVENKNTVKEIKKESLPSKETKPRTESIYKRNVMIMDKYRQVIEKALKQSHKDHTCHDDHCHHSSCDDHRHHSSCDDHCEEWCGDLPFDDLISTENRVRIVQLKREKQVDSTMKLLTKKCPCKSGAYFKFCCYPKIKAWYILKHYIMYSIKRKRYYLNKFRV